MGTYGAQKRKALGDLNVNSQELSSTVDSASWRQWWYGYGLSLGWRRRKNSSLDEKQCAVDESSVDTDDTDNLPPPEYAVIVGPKQASLSNIVSQIGGGPLRKVVSLQQQPFPIVYLEFLYTHHTKFFQDQVRARKCLVNGKAVILCPTQAMEDFFSQNARKLEQFQNTLLQNSQYQKQGAKTCRFRRTLMIRQPMTPSGKVVPLKVSPAHIKAIFGQMGSVLQVRPMFAERTVAYSIEFADVSSAVQAYEKFHHELSFDRETRLKHRECNSFGGLHSWTLEFLDDPAEHTFYF